MTTSTSKNSQTTKKGDAVATGQLADIDLVANSALGEEIIEAIRRALSEDIGSGDVTTDSIVPADARAVAQIVAKQDGIVSGLEVVRAVFVLVAGEVEDSSAGRISDFKSEISDLKFEISDGTKSGISDLTTEISGLKFDTSDGARVVRGQTLIEIKGPARTILTGERTALNFLARMSGIATLTRQFVDAIAGTKARILDTRKTAPGLRAVDKLAVRHGGGDNHRFGLYDMVMIKDNHIDSAGSLTKAVTLARASASNLEIEVEARTIEEMHEALNLGVERILLDNMTLEDLRRAVALCGGRAKLEASGNVSLDNVREIADTGVDFISVGALTHSAKAFDVSLRWVNKT